MLWEHTQSFFSCYSQKGREDIYGDNIDRETIADTIYRARKDNNQQDNGSDDNYSYDEDVWDL